MAATMKPSKPTRTVEDAWDGREYAWDSKNLQADLIAAAAWPRIRLSPHAVAAPGTVGWCFRRPCRHLAAALEVSADGLTRLLFKRGLATEPAQVQYRPETVVREVLKPERRPETPSVAESEPSGGGGLPSAPQPQYRCIPSFIDTWTLEISPAGMEDEYQQRHERLWMPWLAVEKALGVVTTMASLRRLYSSTSFQGRECGALAAVLVAMVLTYIAAVVMAILPAWRRSAFRFLVAAEMVQALTRTVYPTCLQQQMLMDAERDRFALESAEGLWPTEMRIFTTFWLMRFWLRCSYLYKHMLTIAAVNFGALSVLAAYGAPATTMHVALLRLLLLLLLPRLSYHWELRKRRKFLQESRTARLGGAEPAPAPAVRRAGATAPDADAPSPLAEAVSSFAASASDGLQALTMLPRILRFHLRDQRPKDLSAGFGASMLDALAELGLHCAESWIASGCVWLSMVVEGRDVNSVSVDALMAKLEQDPQLQRMLHSGVSVQDGSSLWSPGSSAESPGAGHTVPAAAPEVVALASHILPTTSDARLGMTVRAPRRDGAAAGSWFVVLAKAGSCIKLELPHQLEDDDHSDILHFRAAIHLPHTTGAVPLDAYLLEVCDGEAMSAPQPLLVCSDPKLRVELEALELCLRSNPSPALEAEGVAWALRELVRFHKHRVEQPAALREALEQGAAAGEAAAMAPAMLLQMAEHVRRWSPVLVGLAASLGLPALMRLLLRCAAPAFLLGLCEGRNAAPGGAAAGSAAAGDVAVILPQSEGREPRLGAAMAKLLGAATRSGPFVATVLHMLAISGSAETLLVLQEASARLGMELNWSARVLVPAGADGCELSVSAMQLVRQRLPQTAAVCRLALASGGLAAAAWQEVAGSAERPDLLEVPEVELPLAGKAGMAWGGSRAARAVPSFQHLFLVGFLFLAAVATISVSILLLLSDSESLLPIRILP